MPEFLVRPMEPLYFGPPISFTAGEAHRGVSQFPPTPQTFQGLVRARLLAAARNAPEPNDWSEASRRLREELVGGPDALPASWQLDGPYPACWRQDEEGERQLELWWSAPSFLLAGGPAQEPVRAGTITAPSSWQPLDDLAAEGVDFLPVGAPTELHHGPLGGWISSRNLRWALSGKGHWLNAGHQSQLPPFVARERRPGLVIQRSWRKPADEAVAADTAAPGTAQHGMLYFLDTLRFKADSGLYGQLRRRADGRSDLELDERLDPACLLGGTAGAGRNRRQVAFEPADAADPDWNALQAGNHLPEELPEGARAWVLLLAPVRLPDALRPPIAAAGGVAARVRSALIGPAQVIGGYSVVRRQMRDNRVYVPAGSCWLVELSGGSGRQRAQLVRQWNGAYPLVPPGDGELAAEAAFGFGRVLVGLAATY